MLGKGPYKVNVLRKFSVKFLESRGFSRTTATETMFCYEILQDILRINLSYYSFSF